MTTNHTPTPWRIAGRDGTAWTITDERSTHAAFPVICANNGPRICNVDSREGENCDANAAFIVQAVNSHASLLETAKAALPYLLAAKAFDEAVALEAAIAQATSKETP